MSPVAWPAIVGTTKPVRTHGRIEDVHLGVDEAREGHAARVPDRTCACSIHEDSEQPGLQGSSTLESVQPLQQREPRLLDDVFGGAGADIQPCQADERAVILLHQAGKRRFVTRTEQRHQFDVGASGAAAGLDHEQCGAGPAEYTHAV